MLSDLESGFSSTYHEPSQGLRSLKYPSARILHQDCRSSSDINQEWEIASKGNNDALNCINMQTYGYQGGRRGRDKLGDWN